MTGFAEGSEVLKTAGPSAFYDRNPVVHVEQAQQAFETSVHRQVPMACEAVLSADLTEAVVTLLDLHLGERRVRPDPPFGHAGLGAERDASARDLFGAVPA